MVFQYLLEGFAARWLTIVLLITSHRQIVSAAATVTVTATAVTTTTTTKTTKVVYSGEQMFVFVDHFHLYMNRVELIPVHSGALLYSTLPIKRNLFIIEINGDILMR